ncbi:unnamed protein product [Camellia sinensis]
MLQSSNIGARIWLEIRGKKKEEEEEKKEKKNSTGGANKIGRRWRWRWRWRRRRRWMRRRRRAEAEVEAGLRCRRATRDELRDRPTSWDADGLRCR